MRRWLWALALLSCGCASEPPAQDAIAPFVGAWEASGVRLVVWRDASVLFEDEAHHVRVLSRLERIKGGLGFSIGDRWRGPVRVRRQGDELVLIRPDDLGGRIRLHRARERLGPSSSTGI